MLGTLKELSRPLKRCPMTNAGDKDREQPVKKIWVQIQRDQEVHESAGATVSSQLFAQPLPC